MISNKKYENEIKKMQIDFHNKMKETEDKYMKQILEYNLRLNDLKEVFNSTMSKYIQDIKSLNSRIGGYKRSNNDYQKSIKLLKDKIIIINSEKIELDQRLVKLKSEKDKLQKDVIELDTRLREQMAIVENYNKCFERKFKLSKKEEIINYDRKNM